MADRDMELAGKRIVVVEDDYLVADEICQKLREKGATVLGPAPTPFYAMQLIGNRKLDAAVLDIHLHGATVYEVADMLVGRGVPIIFATGTERANLPKRFQLAKVFEKPLDLPLLLSDIVLMTNRAEAPPVLASEERGKTAVLEHAEEIFARALARSMSATAREDKPG